MSLPRWLTLVVAWLSAGACYAASQASVSGNWHVACSDLVAWSDDPVLREGVIQWVAGCWSGLNDGLTAAQGEARNLLAHLDAGEDLWADVQLRCQAEPDAALMDVARAIFREFPKLELN